MDNLKLSFVEYKTDRQVEDIYNFNMKAFTDSHDFSWTKENIKKELKAGWVLYSAQVGEDIVCAIFLKTENSSLLTKNTPIKINYQGNGFSHAIKEFYESYANNNNLHKVYNYCPIDNFRMISLNEGHDYQRTGNTLGENENMIEWVKEIK